MAASFLRTIIMFLLLLVSMRAMGKRQLGELEPFELVVAVLISNLASQPLGDVGLPLVYGIVPVLTLLGCQLLISALSVRFVRFRRLISGSPAVLILDGRVLTEGMREAGLSPDELLSQLRHSGVTDIATVKEAILETDGTLSIISCAKDAPATPEDLGLAVTEKGVPTLIISEGRTLEDALRAKGLDRAWLGKTLRREGLKGPEEVYLMTVDEINGVYIVRKGEKKRKS